MTVYFNGRRAVHKGCGGVLTTIDPCYDANGTVVDYVNIAKTDDAANCSTRVTVDGFPLCHKQSYFAKSTGDEAGVGGGVRSGTSQGIAEFITASPTIFVDGIAVVREADLMVSNNRNTAAAPLQLPTGQIVQSSYVRKAKPPQRITRPNHIIVDVIGREGKALAGLLGATQGKAHYYTPLARHVSVSQHWRRLQLVSLAAGQHQLHLTIENTAGPDIVVPLAAAVLSEQPQQHSSPPPGKAPHVLIPLRCRWRSVPATDALQPEVGDYTAIAYLPAWCRAQVYRSINTYLSKHQAPLPWPDMLSTAMHARVKTWLQPNKAAHCRPGWLYVFCGDVLWRECQVNEQGQLCEVDLARYAGKNNRPACGVATPFLVVAPRLNNSNVQYAVAFSECQWSWSRVNYFGGMSATDARLSNKKSPIHMPTASQRAKAGQHRKQRFDYLNLAPFMTNTTQSRDSRDPQWQVINMRVLHDDHIPTLFVADPLGLVLRLQQDCQQTWQRLAHVVTQVHAAPMFKSAHLTYQVFFNKKNAHYKVSLPRIDTLEEILSPALSMPRPQPNALLRCQAQLDRHKLENILQVATRKHSRADIRRLQKTLVSMIQDSQCLANPQHYCAQASQQAAPHFNDQGVSFNAAFSDMFSSDIARYGNGYLSVAGLLGLIHNDPTTLDYQLDVTHDHVAAMSYGHAYTLSLYDARHSLHNVIFPTKQQTYKTEKDRNDGSGQFRPFAFAALLSSSDAASLYGIPKRLSEMVAESLKTLVSATARAVRQGDADQLVDIEPQLLRLVKATHNPHLSSLQVFPVNKIPKSYYPVGFDVDRINRFTSHFNSVPAVNYPMTLTARDHDEIATHIKQQNSMPAALANKIAKNAIPLSIRDVTMKADGEFATLQSTTMKQPIIQLSPYSYKDFCGVNHADKITPAALSQQAKKVLYTYRGQVFCQQSSAVPLNKHLIAADRVAATILMGLELYSLTCAVKKNKLKPNTAEVAETLYILFATEGLAKAWLGEDQVFALCERLASVKFVLSQTASILKTLLTPFACAGVLANGLSFMLSLSQLYRAIQCHDDKAVLGHLMTGAGSALGALAILGEGATTLKVATLRRVEQRATQLGGEAAAEDLIALSPVTDWLAQFGPWGWAACAIVLIGSLIDTFWHDSALMTWSKNSPFSKTSNSHLSDRKACETLLSLLLAPQLSCYPTVGQKQTAMYQQVCLEAKLPYFVPGNSQLDMRLQWQQSRYNAIDVKLTELHNDDAFGIKPTHIEQLIGSRRRGVVAIRYYYQYVPGLAIKLDAFGWQRVTTTYLGKARLYLNQHVYRLPAPVLTAENSESTLPQDLTWFYPQPCDISQSI